MSNSSNRMSLSPEKRKLFAMLLKEEGVDVSSRQTIPLRSLSTPSPSSFAQQGLWFLDQLEPGSPFYNIPVAVRLTGSLNVAALKQSLDEIVRRHESLRTTFETVQGRPLQVIAPIIDVPLLLIDLNVFTKTQREAELQRLVIEEGQRPFDLAHGPLLRTTLLRMGEKEHALLVTIHHIVSDDWSTDVFFREFAALYKAYSAGQPSPLPEPPIQYADYAVWQREWLCGVVLEQQLAYWKETLGGSLPILELPTDWPRPAVQTFHGAYETIVLPKKLTEDLKALGQREGVTLFMLLLGAYQTLLSRYTRQEDILVGSPFANRKRVETEGLIGFFLNTLVLRADLSGNPTFRELLARVRETTLGAYEHGDVPFEKLVEELQPERSLSRNPLFQVTFVLRNTPRHRSELPGLTVSPLESDTGASKFDLNLFMVEEDELLKGLLEYSTDLFEAATIRRMLNHFQVLLEGVVTNPEQRISELPLLTETERHQLLDEWNDAQAVYPKEKSLHELFEAQVERTPDAVALVFEQTPLSYRELDRRANQVAHYLRARGIGPETRVGLLMERSIEMVIGILGVLKAGGAYLPLDPAYPQERLSFMLDDAEVPVLLAHERLVKDLPVPHTEVVNIDADWERIAGESPEKLEQRAGPDNVAYVIYTSGSTGKPKGVLVTHYNVVRLFQSTEPWFHFNERDVWTLFHSYAFDFSVWELWGALLYGGRLVIVPYLTSRSAEGFYELLRNEQVTVLNQTPSAFRQLMQAEESAETSGEALALRLVIFGGEALELQTLQPWFLRHGDERPQLVNMYGITETTVHVTYRPLKMADVENTKGSVIGRHIPDLQLYVLDQYKQPVPVGVPGELYVGGAGLACGYLKRPELTLERFIDNPFRTRSAERLYRTGDVGRYLADGDLEYLGRIDQQVKIRGFRIELGEIEAVLLSHPAVKDAVVTAREDEPNDKRLVAYIIVTGDSDSEMNVSGLRNFLTERLPDYMVPSAYVTLEAMPLTPNGKVDRRVLPAPDQSRPDLAEDYVAPRTVVEESIAGVWSEVLGVERVGIYDNFFELGGHSLLATQVLSRLREVLQVELALRTLFESASVAELAERIERARRAEEGLQSPPIRRIRRDQKLPLSFAQEPLWFVDQLRPGSFSYNVPHAIRMTGPLNRVALQRTLESLIARHESLRTTFASSDGEPVQVIAPSTSAPLPLIDLNYLPETKRETETRHLIDEEVQRPFDLAHGPVFRASLLCLSSEEHVLLINLHHIVSDGWSMGVLFREIAVLYEALCTGKPSPLPELPIQYADYAVWQRTWLSDQVFEKQLAYWKQQLSGAPPVLNLSTDRSRPAVQSFRGARQFATLPKDLSEQIKALCRREGVTLFITLLAAFQLMLSRYTGQDDIVVGTDVANRSRLETEGLIGFFINNVVMRTNLAGDPSFGELLERVREVALGAYAHQDLPFNSLVEALKPERSLSHTPLFQILFVLQNMPMSKLELPGLTVAPLEIDSRTAKFDLAVFIEETEAGLRGTWGYKTDLFDEATIARLATHYETLLTSIVAQPEARLSSLKMRTENETKQKEVENRVRQESQGKKLRSVGRKAVDLAQLSSVKTELLYSGQSLPLLVQPTLSESSLAEWASHNRQFIEAHLLEHGAILFRGFRLSSVTDFEQVAVSICPELFGEYGDLPREGIGGKVYGSTPYPADQAILFHNESSHMHRWPMKIWFYCMQPAQAGGETPLVDIRRVYERLNPQLRERFLKKKLMYVRNYIDGLDVSWQTFFHTTKQSAVEDYCRSVGLEFEWKSGGGLRTRQIALAIARHPKTGEMVFFNQIQLHHVSCLDSAVRDSLLEMFEEEALPRNVYYGDGTRIEDSAVEEIVGLYRELEVKSSWQQGDIMMLDNMLTAHGRNPFVGDRKIVVAMGEMINQEDVSSYSDEHCPPPALDTRV